MKNHFVLLLALIGILALICAIACQGEQPAQQHKAKSMPVCGTTQLEGQVTSVSTRPVPKEVDIGEAKPIGQDDPRFVLGVRFVELRRYCNELERQLADCRAHDAGASIDGLK